jgi:basic membrane protein A
MRNRRFIYVVALLAAFMLVVAACGDDDDDDATDTGVGTDLLAQCADDSSLGEDVMVGMAFDIGGRGDLSFNDLAARAYDQTMAGCGFTGDELAPTAGGENREENLRLLAEAGHNFIIANGFAFNQNVGRVAQEFPDVTFAITDDCALDENFAVLDLENVACMLFAEEQGSFLVGVAAALKTEADTLGFIGGVATPLILKFQAGFEAGVAAIDPNITVLVRYLTEAPNFDGFVSPELGKEAALALYDQGADIVYHAAGLSGLGLFEAAKEVSDTTGEKVWAIGVDSDQYNAVAPELQEFILTSMLKRVDLAVATTVQDFLAGEFQPGISRFDLAVEGVGYSTTGGFIDDITDEINEWSEQIASGEIVVPTEP